MARLIVAAALLAGAAALNNGLALTPQLAFNTWNHFHCGINETLIRNTAQALVSQGFAAAGYKYLNLDDCWAYSRDASGTIHEDPTAFPSGMGALSSYVHSLGLYFGLYTDLGLTTCAGRPGSLGFERNDSNTYAQWNVDYIKVDNCDNLDIAPEERYPVMRDALNATGRKIFFSMCEWGSDAPAHWAPLVGNSWRTTNDISCSWSSMTSNMDLTEPLWPYAGPGGWNDPDMLEVGNGCMSEDEEKVHFSLWAMMKAPLIIGCDVTAVPPSSLAILTNPEVIAVSQDAFGKQAKRVWSQGVPLEGTPLPKGGSGHKGSAAHVRKLQSLGATNAIVAPCNASSPAQQFSFVAPAGNPKAGLLIQEAADGRVLDIDGCGDTAGDYINNVSVYPIDSGLGTCLGLNQQWSYNTSSGAIVSAWSAQCLTLDPNNGLNIGTKDCGSVPAPYQTWSYDAASKSLRIGVEGAPLHPDLGATPLCAAVFADVAPGDQEVWAGQLSDGWVVGLVNRGSFNTASITATWSMFGLPQGTTFAVRDLWARADLGNFTDSITQTVNIHGVSLLRLTPA